jgi:hypothetical protein
MMKDWQHGATSAWTVIGDFQSQVQPLSSTLVQMQSGRKARFPWKPTKLGKHTILDNATQVRSVMGM